MQKNCVAVYYKGFDADLCGFDKFPFRIGGIYTDDTDFNWSWFHYTKYASATIIYFAKGMRICEVEPLGETMQFRDSLDGIGKGYFTTNKIRIVRELAREEIFETLLAEKCPFLLLCKLDPPFEVLLNYKSGIRGNRCHSILQMDYLSDEQKRTLLPKRWHKHIARNA